MNSTARRVRTPASAKAKTAKSLSAIARREIAQADRRAKAARTPVAKIVTRRGT